MHPWLENTKKLHEKNASSQ